MARTLLIGSPRTSWREWLRSERKGRDLLCLDPSDPEHGHLARFVLLRGERPLFTRFYGSLDPQRSPHVLVAALARALPLLGEDSLVQLFAYRSTPVLRQTLQLVSELYRPDHILVGADIDAPIAGERIEVAKAFTPAVQQAQRKAHWIALREAGEAHVLELRSLEIEGVRLLSGTVLDAAARTSAGLADAVHAERQGSALFVVAPYDPEEQEIGRALDATGCSRAIFSHPDAYEGLLCSFVRGPGEEFGVGFIDRIDWQERRIEATCDAIPPAPVATLRVGSLRVDRDGNELGEVRMWQV